MEQLKHRLYLILESGRADDRLSRAFDLGICALIILNVAAVVVATVKGISADHARSLRHFEIFSVVVFTLEYVARLWVCVQHPPLSHLPALRARLNFARTPYAVIDLLAIAPFYLGFLFAIDLRVLRILRLARLLKLARYSSAVTTIFRVLMDERRALVGVLVVMGSLTVVTGTFAYYVERVAQPEAFGSIPRAMWWALATLTTVGYGDVVPVTAFGKLLGSLVMLFGVGLFALPVAIISTGFAQELHRREFVVSWGMVARIPLFSHLSPAEMVEVARHLSSHSYRAGAIIARPGEPADSLYLIVSGKVLVEPEGAPEPMMLAEGDWFGEAALIARGLRRVTLSTTTDCRLLVLESSDFHQMMHADEHFRRRIFEGLHARGAGHDSAAADES